MEGVELPEGLPAAFCAAIEADEERLVEAMAALEQLPQVRIVPSSLFDRAKPPGSVAQQRGVGCKLSSVRNTSTRSATSWTPRIQTTVRRLSRRHSYCV